MPRCGGIRVGELLEQRRLEDRYHEHILATPTVVRNVLFFVLGNRAIHLARWGTSVARDAVDPFSSLAVPLVQQPQSWLLREGWTRARPPRP